LNQLQLFNWGSLEAIHKQHGYHTEPEGRLQAHARELQVHRQVQIHFAMGVLKPINTVLGVLSGGGIDLGGFDLGGIVRWVFCPTFDI